MDHGKLANSLWEAEQIQVQIGRLTDLYPEMSVEDAYRIQLANAERRANG